MAPQFIYIELPSFRAKSANGNNLRLNFTQLGLLTALYQYVRSGLRTSDQIDLSTSLLFSDGESDLWTSTSGNGTGDGSTHPHAEENMLLSYYQAFDSPGAYPIVDAMLLHRGEPCANCAGYFTLGGKTLRTADGSFRAKFTARSDRSYTPVFYVARGLDGPQRAALWAQMATVHTGDPGIVVGSHADVPVGQAYYVLHDSPWFAINGQEGMTDEQIATAIARQGVLPTYWVGR